MRIIHKSWNYPDFVSISVKKSRGCLSPSHPQIPHRALDLPKSIPNHHFPSNNHSRGNKALGHQDTRVLRQPQKQHQRHHWHSTEITLDPRNNQKVAIFLTLRPKTGINLENYLLRSSNGSRIWDMTCLKSRHHRPNGIIVEWMNAKPKGASLFSLFARTRSLIIILRISCLARTHLCTSWFLLCAVPSSWGGGMYFY